MNIYIGNLNYKVEESDLKQLFEKFGEVSTVKVVKDKYTGKSKGFGFIVMDNSNEAGEAITNLNGSEMSEREIVVNEAKPKSESFFKK